MYYDDLRVIYHRANLVMKGFDTEYTINPDADGKKWAESTTYIGYDITKFQVSETGETFSSKSGDTYIKDEIKNVYL